MTLVVNAHTDVKGVCTLYSDYGEDQNKHVLFIHGLGASSFAWRDIPLALSQYFHTISVDLIGFGGSGKPETADYTIKGFSKFIVDFLERIGIKGKENKNISIVGHSLGGYIAAQVAIKNNDRKACIDRFFRHARTANSITGTVSRCYNGNESGIKI